jgi:hypothetical protein
MSFSSSYILLKNARSRTRFALGICANKFYTTNGKVSPFFPVKLQGSTWYNDKRDTDDHI